MYSVFQVLLCDKMEKLIKPCGLLAQFWKLEVINLIWLLIS